MGIFGDPKKRVQKMQKKGDVMGLIKALGHKDHQVRCEAIQALGKLKDKRAVSALIQIIGSEKALERGLAARALGDIGDERGVEALSRAAWASIWIGDREDKWSTALLNEAALDALEKIGTQAAVEALVNLTTHSEEKIRALVAQKLGMLGNPAAVEALIERTRLDISEWVQTSAATALARFADADSIEAIARTWPVIYPDTRERIRELLAEKAGPAALEALDKALRQD
jgi:HEAT repeat protein